MRGRVGAWGAGPHRAGLVSAFSNPTTPRSTQQFVLTTFVDLLLRLVSDLDKEGSEAGRRFKSLHKITVTASLLRSLRIVGNTHVVDMAIQASRVCAQDTRLVSKCSNRPNSSAQRLPLIENSSGTNTEQCPPSMLQCKGHGAECVHLAQVGIIHSSSAPS